MAQATDLLDNTYTSTYTSFAGTDIQAVLDGRPIGNLMGISYSVTREKAPIYTMGSVDPRGYSRGKRGIAGSLVFTIFDRSALSNLTDKNQPRHAKYFAKFTDVASPGEFSASRGSDIAREDAAGLLEAAGGQIGPQGTLFHKDLRNVNYVDQMPPFDIVLSGENELGTRMFMQILGVELLNQGSGVSVDDIVIESQMTFVARSIIDWKTLENARGTNTAQNVPTT